MVLELFRLLKEMKFKLILLLILLLAGFIRFYKIDQVPPSLSWDEVSIGYNGYSILKTGRDEWGESFPLAFKSFGEYKYPFHIYATTISIFLFGLNEFAVRFPSAFFGIVNIFLLYLLVLKLFKNQFVALTSAFLLTISPWHIQFSRVAWETNFAFFFFLLGMLCFLKALDKRNYFLILSFIFFGFAIFTYNAAKVFIVLFIPLLLFSQWKNIARQKKIILISLLIFATLMTFNLLDSRLSGINRFKQLDFMQEEVVKTTTYKLTRVYSLGKIEMIIRQYLTYFSPQFLFISGDSNLRHSTQAIGQVYWLELLPVLLGTVFMFRKERKLALLILGWIILAPIPGSFTREAPHASRSMFMLGAWHILAAIGLYYLYLVLKKYRRFFMVTFLFLISSFFVNYYFYYLNEYPKISSESWKYGYKQAISYIAKNYDNYDLIVLARIYGEPQIFTLFYLKYPPEKFQTDQNLVRERKGDWIEVTAFDKFKFPDLGNEETTFKVILKNNPGKKILFLGKRENFPKEISRLLSINFLNGQNTFDIIEAK